MTTLIYNTDAISHFTSVFAEATLAHDMGPQPNCTEADALSDLFAALGEMRTAALWNAAHAAADEAGDKHHQEAVEEYVVPVDPMDELQCDSCQ